MDRLPLGLFCILLLLAGCSGDEPGFTVEERDGVSYAINRGTNVWTDTAAVPLQFEYEQTFGTNEGSGPDLLGTVRGVAVDSVGTVYVLDADNHRLVAFNLDGSVQWSAGREGEGPGEFQRPRGMVMGDDDRLFVANNSGQQIDIWTTDGDFVERQTFQDSELSFLTLVGFAENHLIASETGFGEDPQRIHALDPNSWEVVHSYPLDLNLDLPEGLATSAEATTIGDSIYVSSITAYTLRRFSLDGTLERRISREIDFLVGPGVYTSGGSRGIRVYSSLSAPVRLPGGWYLVEASSATNIDDPDAHVRRSRNDTSTDPEYAVLLDLFRPSGRYVGSLRWDGRRTSPIGEPTVVGPNGKLYTTTTDPFPQIRRYEVTVEGL